MAAALESSAAFLPSVGTAGQTHLSRFRVPDLEYSRGRGRNRYRNRRPSAVPLPENERPTAFDSDTDTDSDPEMAEQG